MKIELITLCKFADRWNVMKKGSQEFIPIGNVYLKHICCNCYLFCPIADIQYELLKYDFRNMALETVSN